MIKPDDVTLLSADDLETADAIEKEVDKILKDGRGDVGVTITHPEAIMNEIAARYQRGGWSVAVYKGASPRSRGFMLHIRHPRLTTEIPTTAKPPKIAAEFKPKDEPQDGGR